MRAWRVHRLGEPADVLTLDDVVAPEPGPGEVRVTVAACGLNLPDVLQCRGTYQERPPLPFVPGVELVGRVDALGPGAAADLGQRVIALPIRPGGGLAESTLALDTALFPVPDAMPDTEAAALMIAHQTAWVALHRRGGLSPGEWLVVTGAAGGVGSAAVQLGAAAGARVIAVAGGADRVGACRAWGAEAVIDHTTTDVAAAVRELTAGAGADVVLDLVGGDLFAAARRFVAFEGRIVVAGFAGGIPDVPANHVLLRNYSVVGAHWSPYAQRDPGVLWECHATLLDLYERGHLRPAVGLVAPFAEAPRALAALAGRAVVGKAVVTLAP